MRHSLFFVSFDIQICYAHTKIFQITLNKQKNVTNLTLSLVIWHFTCLIQGLFQLSFATMKYGIKWRNSILICTALEEQNKPNTCLHIIFMCKCFFILPTTLSIELLLNGDCTSQNNDRDLDGWNFSTIMKQNLFSMLTQRPIYNLCDFPYYSCLLQSGYNF